MEKRLVKVRPTKIRSSSFRLGTRALTLILVASAAVAYGQSGSAATARPRGTTAGSPNTFSSPMWESTIGDNIDYSSPTFATIEGARVIVAASLSGEIYVVNARTGSEMPGWPQAVRIDSSTPTEIDSSPVVAYLDGPQNQPTIIVGAGSRHDLDQNGGVVAFYADGRLRWIFKDKSVHQGGVSNGYTDEVFSSPAVGDITGDGQQDIVFGSFDHWIYALTPSGTLVPGFPINRGDSIWASPSLADISHTGKDDIIIGQASSGVHTESGVPCWGGFVVDYRYNATARMPELQWEDCTGESIFSSSAIGVLNPGPDNRGNVPAVVTGTSIDPASPSWPNNANEVFAMYASSGRELPGWPVRAPGITYASPVIAQATQGGPPVVLEVSCPGCSATTGAGTSVLSEWSSTGHLNWTTRLNLKLEGLASPMVVNVTGSGSNDVVVSSTAGVMIINASNGSYVDGTGSSQLQGGCQVLNTPAVSAVSGVAGGYEIVFSCYLPHREAQLWAYPLGHTPDQAFGWSGWRAGGYHTGVADPPTGGKLPCAALKEPAGYRVIREDGKVLDFGSLKNCGGLSTELLPSPVVGMASSRNGGGYLVALRDGKVYAFGNVLWRGDGLGADWQGPSTPPGAPTVGIAVVSNGSGYYLLDGEGHVYAFGTGAPYYGSPASPHGVPVSIVTNPVGTGYWVVTSDGDVYSYGGAARLASVSGPTGVVGATATLDGKGLWLVSSNGAVHTTGDAKYMGAPRNKPQSPIVGIATAPSGRGYWMVETNGTVDVFPYPGALRNWGSANDQSEPIVAISAA
jgi:hypothetical protein